MKQLEGMFDVAPAERSERRWSVDLPFEERDWNIGLIVGPSGCGKSTLAGELFGPARQLEWPTDRSVVDSFPSGCGIKEITGLLSSVGFSSPPSWLRPFGALSTGEQFRVTVARTLAENPELAVIDEFTSVVDRTVAQVGSAAVAKAVRRSGRKLVAVSCHYDIIEWLQPDWMFDPSSSEFQWRCLQRHPEIKLEISRVHRSAWQCKSSKCFCGFIDGRPAAFTGVMHAPSTLGGYWREHRTVCLPDFQGIGIGNAMSEYVASLFVATGKKYSSVTGNPAMIHHRAKSRQWVMFRKPGHANLQAGKHVRFNARSSRSRITASFRYAGETRRDEAVKFGLIAANNSADGSTKPSVPRQGRGSAKRTGLTR